MKMTSGVEQAVCILLMLASQHDGLPLKSVTLSTRLQVSESYLKKVLRKLVVGGLINSSASKTGGFTLAKSDESINLLEVFEAIEGSEPFFVPSKLVEKVFLLPDNESMMVLLGIMIVCIALTCLAYVIKTKKASKSLPRLIKDTD